MKRKFRGSRARKTLDYTSLNQTGHNVYFRGKKTPKSVFRRHLWDSTLFKQHYRSVISVSSTISTPATYTTGTLQGINMYQTPGGAFWQVGGGALPPDVGGAVPTFTGDIILRGGRFELNIHNPNLTDVRIKLMQLTTVATPDFTLEPVTPPFTWDTSAQQDFNQRLGKPFIIREVTIEGGQSYTYTTRFKMQKIDQGVYAQQGRSPVLYLLASNIGSTVAASIRVTTGFNLSFSGEAI